MIGICVGHSRKGDEGAYTSGEYSISEWDFNRDLARRISHVLSVEHKIYNDYELNTYSAAIRNVARKMKSDGVKAAVELHFNAASTKPKGMSGCIGILVKAVNDLLKQCVGRWKMLTQK